MPTPRNEVTAVAAAPSDVALEHFSRQFQFETDCYDVHSTAAMEPRGFVLLDVRSRARFDHEHLPGAVHLPHREIQESRMADYPMSTLFVVYCGGPHCNGAARAALRLASLGRPVKLMTGGIEGWKDEGLPLASH